MQSSNSVPARALGFHKPAGAVHREAGEDVFDQKVFVQVLPHSHNSKSFQSKMPKR